MVLLAFCCRSSGKLSNVSNVIFMTSISPDLSRPFWRQYFIDSQKFRNSQHQNIAHKTMSSNLLEQIAKMNGGCAPDGTMLNPMSNLVDSFGNAAVRPRYVHLSFFFFFSFCDHANDVSSTKTEEWSGLVLEVRFNSTWTIP